MHGSAGVEGVELTFEQQPLGTTEVLIRIRPRNDAADREQRRAPALPAPEQLNEICDHASRESTRSQEELEAPSFPRYDWPIEESPDQRGAQAGGDRSPKKRRDMRREPLQPFAKPVCSPPERNEGAHENNRQHEKDGMAPPVSTGIVPRRAWVTDAIGDGNVRRRFGDRFRRLEPRAHARV